MIANYVNIAFQFYNYLIFARILMSWFKLPNNKFLYHAYNFVYDLTEPVLGVFRRLMPPAMIGAVGIDFSPIIAFFVLGFIRRIVVQLLFSIGI